MFLHGHSEFSKEVLMQQIYNSLISWQETTIMVMMITKETTSARTPIAIRVICHPIRLCSVQVFGTSRKKRNVTEVEIRKMTTWTFIKHITYICRKYIPKSSSANKFGWCKVKVNTIEYMHAIVIKCIETIGMACQTARCLPTKLHPYQLLTLFLGFWMIQCISVVIYMYLHLAALCYVMLPAEFS